MWKVSALVAAAAVAVVSGQECNYVLINEGDDQDPDYNAYALGQCQSAVSADGSVSRKYICSDDDSKVEVTSYENGDCSGDEGVKTDAEDVDGFKCNGASDCEGIALTIEGWENEDCSGNVAGTLIAYYVTECVKIGDDQSGRHECGTDVAKKMIYDNTDCSGDPSGTESISKTCAAEDGQSAKASCEAGGGDDSKDGCNFVIVEGLPYGIGKCQSFGEGSGKVACKDGKPELSMYESSTCSGNVAETSDLSSLPYECGMASDCGSVQFTVTEFAESDCKGDTTENQVYLVYECIPYGDGYSNLDCASDKFTMYSYSDADCSKDKETKAYASDECLSDSDQTIKCTADAIDNAIDEDKSAAHSLTGVLALLVAAIAAFAQ